MNGNRSHQNENHRGRGKQHHRQGAPGRMEPDNGRARARGGLYPVQGQGQAEPGGGHPGAVAHPAAVPYPAQRGPALVRRQPR